MASVSTRREVNSIARFMAGVGFYFRSTELSVITYGLVILPRCF
jgi:hypothetical protein